MWSEGGLGLDNHQMLDLNEIYDDAVIIETGAGKIKFEKAAISRELTAARYSKTTDKAEKSEKAVEEKN